MEGEGGRTASHPPTLSGTVFSCDRSFFCAHQGWEQRGFLGHQAVVRPGKHRAQRQNLTGYFYFISCHKTHFLGGYTPASPPLGFCLPLRGEGPLRSSPKLCSLGLLQQALGPSQYRLGRGSRDPGL